MSIFLGNLTTIEEARANSSDLELQQLLHDIKSPIMAMMAGVNYIEKFDRAGNSSQDALNIIKMATERLNSLTTNNSGLQQFEVLPAVQSIVAEKTFAGISILQLDDMTMSDTSFAEGSSSAFKAIMSNLINNSAEAHASEIRISASENKNHIQISIQDDGCGMDSAKLALIGKKQITDKVGGQGLGLSNAVKQIKDWGGEILIESRVGMGTTIKIVLKRV